MYRLTSRKLLTFVVAGGSCWIGFERVLNALYALPEHSVPYVATVYGIFMATFGVLVCTYMGANVAAARFSTAAQVVSRAESILDITKKNIKIEGQPGSPEIRPFSQNAVDEEDGFES